MTTKKIVILSTIVGILIILSAYFFSAPMKKTNYSKQNQEAFDTTGFIDAQKLTVDETGERIYEDVLTETNKLVAQQGDFSLFLDETTTQFYVEDSKNNRKWRSNPENASNNSQKSTLSITYLETAGATSTVKTVNNYQTSLNHKGSIDYEKEGRKTYSIKYVKDGFQILFELTDLEIGFQYIPRFITEEVYNTVTKSLLQRASSITDNPSLKEESELTYIRFKDTYRRDTQREGIFQILEDTYVKLDGPLLKSLYSVYYPATEDNRIAILGEYSVERVYEENLSYGFEKEVVTFNLTVGIEVKVTKEGFSTKLITNSIEESKNNNITEIQLYPLLGAVSTYKDDGVTLSEGQLIIPDGSGAVINFNNGKGGEANGYKARMYGDDLSMMSYQYIDRQKLIFPLFGLVNEDSGFSAIITEGDAMTFINANVSSNSTPYNSIFPSFIIRETETVTIGTGISAYRVMLSTKEKINTNFEVQYSILDSTENTYTGIAKKYQSHLINNANLKVNDKTTKTKLTLELLGAYDEKNFFLGVPYNTQKSLTTFKQASQIVNKFVDSGITDMNVIYLGAINGGLSQELINKTKFEKVLGGKKGFEAFQKEMEELNIDISIDMNITSTSSFNRAFDEYKYAARRISGENAREFSYDDATNVYKNEIVNHPYVINPLYYEHLYNKADKNNNIKSKSLVNIGSTLGGNYNKKEAFYKQDSLIIQKQLLESMEDNLVLSTPLGFAIPYANYIIDLPTKTTLFTIVDYEIPLVQLVLSGVTDYTTSSINLSSNRSIEYDFMKALETGSNLKYTLSYDSSEKLINTSYNNYFSTYLNNWEEIINKHYVDMNNTNIHGGSLKAHRRVANNVYESTYSNNVKVIVNYNQFDVQYNGKTIGGINYLVEVI